MYTDARLQPDPADPIALYPYFLTYLVHIRYDPVRHQLAVPLPVLAIFSLALLLITALAVDEEHSEVRHEKIRDDHAPAFCFARNNVLLVRVLEEDSVFGRSIKWVRRCIADDVTGGSSGQNVRPRHKPVTEVVDVACGAPPAGDEELGAGLGLNVLEMLDARVIGVGAEAVLLVVDGAEDVVADGLDGEDGYQAADAEFDGVSGQVACLQAVCEGHPDKITERKHQSEAVADDVDGCQHGRLHVVAVKDVESLRKGDEKNGVCDFPEVAVLLHDEGQIEHHPAKHAGADFSPGLDVDLAKDGKRDARVEFTTDEPVVQDVAAVATLCKLAHAGVHGVLDGEGANVHIGSQRVRGQNVE
jgi:hypothetical protein